MISCNVWSGSRWLYRPTLGVALALSLGACAGGFSPVASVASALTPYKVDILQGNVLTQEQVQVLQTGMSREQVRDILGTPLLTSVFHADRWDYVFTLKRQGQASQRRHLSVWFKDDRLVRFDGDEVPTEQGFVESLEVEHKAGPLPPLAATPEQLQAFEAKHPLQVPVAPPAPPAVVYPPLEPKE
jgi:outer membrane protein assembly factor BamE